MIGVKRTVHVPLKYETPGILLNFPVNNELPDIVIFFPNSATGVIEPSP